MAKVRVDVLLTERGLAESRAQAQRLLMAGQVRVDGQVVSKAATQVDAGAVVSVEEPPRFVSRGGEKSQAALEAFNIAPEGRVCADVGASTGGFTDCLLQAGARRVYAIDVGKGVLHWKLRQDERVVVMEGTNARYLKQLPEAVSLVTVDVSFISLKRILPVVKGWLGGEGGDTSLATPTQNDNDAVVRGGLERDVIALIKPQFEAGREQVKRGSGVIRDPGIHRQVLLDVLEFAEEEGYEVRGLMRSPLVGPKGNLEFLAWLGYPGEKRNLEALIGEVLPEVEG